MAWLWLALPWRRHKKLKTVICPPSLPFPPFAISRFGLRGQQVQKNLLWHRLSYRQRQRRSSLADKDNTHRMWLHTIRHPLPLPQPPHRYHPHQAASAASSGLQRCRRVGCCLLNLSLLTSTQHFGFRFQFHFQFQLVVAVVVALFLSDLIWNLPCQN